jgi:predicted transporter
MQDTTIKQQRAISPFLIAVVLSSDALTGLSYGIVFFVIAGVSDPIDFSIQAKESAIRLGESVLLASFLYCILCFVTLRQWAKQKHSWSYIGLSLVLIHLVVSALFVPGFVLMEVWISTATVGITIVLDLWLVFAILARKIIAGAARPRQPG